MTTINRLTVTDDLNVDDKIAVWDTSNSDTRGATLTTLLRFMQDNFGVTQYEAPAASGFIITLDKPTEQSTLLIITPDAGYAVGNLQLPTAPDRFDGQIVGVICTEPVTDFNITSAGATIVGAPATLGVYSSFTLRYSHQDSTWYTLDTTGIGQGSASITRNDYTGNGSQTVYTLTTEPETVNNTQVYIDGVYQEKDTYGVSGTTLTFTQAPPLNSSIEVLVIAAGAILPSAYSGQVVTATAGQTVFTTTTTYTPGANSVLVFVNGLRMLPGSDYLETDANTVTFTSGLTSGDEVAFLIGRVINETIGAEQVGYQPGGVGAVATDVQTKLRETVSVKDFGAVGDGVTDDTAAIQAAMDYVASVGARKILFPAGTYNHTGLVLGSDDSSDQVLFIGEGGHTSNTTLVCTATSGHGVRIRARSSGIHGMRIDSSSARRSALSPSDNVFELLVARDDTAGLLGVSRTELSDVFITNGGSHGLGSIWNTEFANWNLITVHGCKGHPAIFDDGTTIGYTNKLQRPFEVKISKLRAFECGGQVLIGALGQTETPRMILLEQLECLDIAQDKNVTGETNAEDAYMVVIRAPNTKVVMPDCENQRYASSTDEFGNSIPALTIPVRGIAVRSANCIIEMPYSSSLSRHGDTVANGTKIILPTSFSGTYGTPALEGWSCNVNGVLGLYFEALTSENTGATELLENQSQTNQIFIDTVQYLGINFSAYDWAMPLSPVTRTISSGVVNIAESYVSLDGEGDTTDSLSYVRMLSGGATDAGRAGCFVRLVNDNSYDITLVHAGTSVNGGAMFFKSGANVVLRGVSAGNDQREVVLNYNPTQNCWYEA